MANKPNNPSLWSKAKSMAKQKFNVYPSAYANGWAAKWYKSKGGTWRSAQEGGMIYKPIYQTSGSFKNRRNLNKDEVRIDGIIYNINHPNYRDVYEEKVAPGNIIWDDNEKSWISVAAVDVTAPRWDKNLSVKQNEEIYQDSQKRKEPGYVANQVRRGTGQFARGIGSTGNFALEAMGAPMALGLEYLSGRKDYASALPSLDRTNKHFGLDYDEENLPKNEQLSTSQALGVTNPYIAIPLDIGTGLLTGSVFNRGIDLARNIPKIARNNFIRNSANMLQKQTDNIVSEFAKTPEGLTNYKNNLINRLKNTEEGKKRLATIGLDPEDIDDFELTFNDGDESFFRTRYASPDDTKLPDLNIDYKQLENLKIDPRTAMAHEFGHYLQELGIHKKYKNYLEQKDKAWQKYKQKFYTDPQLKNQTEDQYFQVLNSRFAKLNNLTPNTYTYDDFIETFKDIDSNKYLPKSYNTRREFYEDLAQNSTPFDTKIVDDIEKSYDIEKIKDLENYSSPNFDVFKAEDINQDFNYFKNIKPSGMVGFEPYAHLREFRKDMMNAGILKNEWDEITEDMIDQFMKSDYKSRIKGFSKNDNEFRKNMSNLLNKYPAVVPAAIVTGAGIKMLNNQRQGNRMGGRINYQTSGTVKIDNKNYNIKSPEYRKMYDEGVIASVDAEGVPTFYKDESIWDDYYEDKRKNKVADAVRRGTAMFARPILDTALEMSGVPGAIRFSKDPIKNLSGTGKVLSNFTVPALAMNTYNYMQGRPFFNISNEDLEGLGNTLDVVGLAAPLAGTLVKGGLKYAPNLLRKAPKFIKPNLINESLDLVNPKLKFANQSVDASKILEPQTIVDNTPWSMQEMPGLHIKSTMTGSPFEKQLSKTGDLNVNNIKAHINKADVSQQDKFILEKVLNEKFPGQQKINYNDFRKAVQEELVDLQKVPIEDYEHKLWGVNELGFPGFKRKSYETSLKFLNKDNLYYSNVKNYNKNNLEKVIQDGKVKYKVPARFQDYDYVPENNIDSYLDYVNKEADDFFTKQYPKVKEIEETLKKLPEVEILTFENLDKFGKGNPKHFNDNTLLHSRGMIEPDNPDIYHILEQQSDYYQDMPRSIDLGKLPIYNSKLLRKQEELIKDQQLLDYMKKNGKTPNGDEVMAWQIDQFENRILQKENELKQLAGNLKNPIQKEFLGKSHQERLLQENVKHAAERGMSKVRLPTSESAAKIQKYQKVNSLKEIDNASKDLELIENPEAFADKYQIIRDDYYGKIADQNIIKKLEEYQKNPQEFINKRNAILQKHYHAISSSGLDINTLYKPEHETVLRKYNEMEKMIQKTIGVKPRKVTDAKGNSWLEFDIPESYKQGKAEIRAFRSGGRIQAQDGVQFAPIYKQEGGRIKAQTSDIIYVSDPNDPRLKMYQDSTTMYNTTKPFLDEIAKQNRTRVYNQDFIGQLQSNNLGFFDTNPLYDNKGNIRGQSQSSKVPIRGIAPINYTTVYAGEQPWMVGTYKKPVQPVEYTKSVYVPPIDPKEFEITMKDLDNKREKERLQKMVPPLQEPQKIKEVDLSRGLGLGMTPEDAAIYAQMEGLGYYDRNGHVPLVPKDMVNLYKSYKANNQHFNYFKPNAIYYSGGEYYWPTEEERLQMIGNPEYVKEWVEKARYRRYGKKYDDFKKSNPEMFRGPGVGYFGHNKLGGKINRKGGNIPCYTCGGQIYRKR